MESKPVSASSLIQRIRNFPRSDIAPSGQIIQTIHSIAFLVAQIHAGRSCFPFTMETIRFIHPIRKEDFLVCMASVNHAWSDSMEIGVKVVSEDFRSLEQRKILSAYFTFMAIDSEEESFELPQVIPETLEQMKRFEAAECRRQMRLVTQNLGTV